VVKSNFRGDLVSHIWEKTPKLSVILYNSLNSVSAKKSQKVKIQSESDFMPARASPSGKATLCQRAPRLPALPPPITFQFHPLVVSLLEMHERVFTWNILYTRHLKG